MADIPQPSFEDTVLVVEDAEGIRKMICTMLSQIGYRVLEAADGAEALEMLEGPARSARLVLTDIIMPNMGGAELAEHLARKCPSLPIIFMSGYSEEPLVQTVEKNTSAFLAKPFTAAALTEKVREALRGDPPTDGDSRE